MGKGKVKRKMWIVLLIIVGVIVIAAGAGILATEPGRRELKELTISDINFGRLSDGTYVGEYTGIKDHTRDTQVEATISDGKITNIKILKGALGKDGKPAELTGGLSIGNLFDNVIKAQSLKVDVISGA
ncbi:MAG: FMN-binding protein, partial [Clostridiales bacterium]|nr:FMN-binding protein [Clostridiales bacterium]